MRIRIYPWRSPSESATSLRNAFQEMGHNALLIRREDSRYRPVDGDIIINWGASEGPPDVNGANVTILNKGPAVAAAANKRDALTRMRDAGVSTVDFTSSIRDARSWLDNGVELVFCRRKLRSSQGAGIVVANTADHVVDAPLYTKGETGKEYRVHVMIDRDGNAHTVKVQKRWKENDDCQVRNHANGYTFITGGFRRPHHIRDLAADAVKALGLDFGSVDIINAVQPDGSRVLKVLEVNTASGLDGSSPRTVAEAFEQYLFPDPQEAPPEESYTFDPDTEIKVLSN